MWGERSDLWRCSILYSWHQTDLPIYILKWSGKGYSLGKWRCNFAQAWLRFPSFFYILVILKHRPILTTGKHTPSLCTAGWHITLIIHAEWAHLCLGSCIQEQGHTGEPMLAGHTCQFWKLSAIFLPSLQHRYRFPFRRNTLQPRQFASNESSLHLASVLGELCV